jgi:hypothetical protein
VDARSERSTARQAFCDRAADYIVALDRDGDLLANTAPTVGDVSER